MLSNERLRKSYLKGKAYICFAIEEENIQNDNFDLTAALVTAETNNMPMDLSSEEYIERAIREIAVAENETESDWLRKELHLVRNKLQNQINSSSN